MKISKAMSDAAIAEELFNRLETQRKALGLTQEDIAERVGITRKSYGALKQGVTKLATFIAILRQLELLDNLEQLAHRQEQSPLFALFGQSRSSKKAVSTYQPVFLKNTAAHNIKREPDNDPIPTLKNQNPILAKRQKLITKD